MIISDGMIGPDKATLHVMGKINPMYMLNLPKSLVREIIAKGIQFEHLDRFRVWLEPTGQKAIRKPHGFKKIDKSSDLAAEQPPEEEGSA